MKHAAPTHRARRRGSVLIVTLLLTAALALVLGSYFNLTLGSERIARRSLDRAAAFQLADAGVEEAVWSYNQALAGNAGWSGWSGTGSAAWRQFNGFSLTPGSTGTVKVYASSTAASSSAGAAPTVLAQATVQTGTSAPVTQTVEVTLRRRGYFANGLVALRKLEFKGRNTSFDSWDSDPDRNPATPPVDYATTVRSDTGNIATGATGRNDDGTSLYLKKARIHGYLTTAGASPDVDDGLVGSFNARAGEVDPARVAADFVAAFPVIAAPADGTWLNTFGSTLGTAGQSTRWRAAQLRLSGKQTLTILGDVTLVLTAQPGTDAIFISSSLIIPNGSRLTIYFEGDATISGTGLANGNVQPASLVLWGGNNTARGQQITLAGKSVLRAVIYAPSADISLTGSGDMMGSIVARDIIFTGNAAFHYDRSLETLTTHGRIGVQTWRQLSPQEQAARASVFAGW